MMMKFTSVISLLTASALASAVPSIKVQADGVSFIGRARKGLSEFLGIPYARSKRWSVPFPIEYGEEVDATMFGPQSFQDNLEVSPFQKAYNNFISYGADEDCLNLNVMTPFLDRNLPVIIYLHSGDFYSGGNAENSCDSGNLVKELRDVVVVTPNYRLGPSGWAYHPNLRGEIKGNFGILDIIESIRWVGKYIKLFGGDDKNITLMGHAAGGIIATYLLEILARPEYADVAPFVSRVVISSANHMMIPLKAPDVAAKNFVQMVKDLDRILPLGAHEDSPPRKPFFKMNADEIVDLAYEYVYEDMVDNLETARYRRTYGPVKDGIVIKAHFHDLLTDESTTWLKVPVLLTAMKDDGSFMVPTSVKAMKEKAVNRVLQNFFSKVLTNPAQFKKLAPLYQSKDETIPVVFGRMLTDALFHAPMNFMHRGLKAAGLDVRHIVLGEEYSLPFQLVEGSPVKAALAPFGAFHYSDHVLFFKPEPMGDQADAFKLVPNGSNHIRRLLMDFVRSGYGGKAVKKLVAEEAELGNPRLSIWTEKRDLPLNWQLAGLALTLDKQ